MVFLNQYMCYQQQLHLILTLNDNTESNNKNYINYIIYLKKYIFYIIFNFSYVMIMSLWRLPVFGDQCLYVYFPAWKFYNCDHSIKY